MRNKLAMLVATALLAAGQAAMAADYTADNLTARYGDNIHWRLVNNAGELSGLATSGALELRLRSGSVTYAGDSWTYLAEPTVLANDGTAYFVNTGFDGAWYTQRRDVDGTISELPSLPNPPWHNYRAVGAVNDSGVAVGYASTSSGDARAVIFQDGQATTIGTFSSASSATGINNHGTIVGTTYDAANLPETFLYANGQVSTISAHSWDARINDAGLVAGVRGAVSASQEAYHTVFLYQDGVMSDLRLDGLDYSELVDLNNAGQVLGKAFNTSLDTAWFLHQDGETILLDKLLASAGYAGWRIGKALDINDNGQILVEVYSEASGVHVWQELLLSPTLPVPEPGTWAMLLAGLGCVAMVKRRRAAMT